MKRIAVIFASLFAISSFSAIVPMTSFTPGAYETLGSYLADNGGNGDVEGYLAITTNGWTSVQFRNSTLYIYEYSFSIDDFGFTTVAIKDVSNPASPVNYTGIGNCANSQCHIHTPLSNGDIHQNYYFNADGSITYDGSVLYNDGTPHVQWEGSAVLLP